MLPSQSTVHANNVAAPYPNLCRRENRNGRHALARRLMKDKFDS